MIDALIEMLYLNNPLLFLFAGLAIGLIHAFEPDHLSAVSTQLLKKSSRAMISKNLNLRNLTVASSLRGVFWGMGHTSSIILIGLLVAGLSLSIPDNFFVGAEFVVGFMLIFLGVLTAKNRNIFKQKHIHPHKHLNGISHSHHHKHDGDHRHGHKAYLIGCVHGIAGSGSLVAIAVSTIGGFDMALYFLSLFGVGSIIGMAVAGGILGLPFILFPKIGAAIKYLRYVIAGISLIIGFNIVFTIGFDNQLFLLS
ncbi:MAG: high frequency lysogenization protein HflD [Nitrosopumilus sp.]